TATAILNGANEVAVEQFLAGTIGFMAIADRVAAALERVPVRQNPTLAEILSADAAAREIVSHS
ncbi:MAG: 1-deoxy-D-xylulose-5-phosphate reductoisomerase, partial [Pseudoflavonifractor sp.]